MSDSTSKLQEKSPRGPTEIKKQNSEEEKWAQQNGGHSTFENSSEHTHSRSKGQIIDSFSDEEDNVYVPFEHQGDGRKREAKRHKQQAVVAQDEIEIDRMIKNYQNSNLKIIESEQALEELKTLDITKKELQSRRNKWTAQLSRDRSKVELTYLKTMGINYLRILRRLDKILAAKENWADG